MITSVNKSNADKYSYLYEQASEYLMTHDDAGIEVELGSLSAMMPAKKVEDADGNYVYKRLDPKTGLPTEEFAIITSLEEYFSYMVELGTEYDKKTGQKSKPSHFSVLPLDEDVFEIDANTRLIKVPSSFATNGISVQGDEVAEVIYFEINRFYDAQDLSLKDIYIQWTAPNGKSGVSTPWVVDIESKPGYIIFGWPLSSVITEKAGTVSFSVRFYSISETSGKVDYSLATLTQTATIKESLNYGLTTLKTDGLVVDNATNLISGRFENTTPTNSAVDAKQPEFIINFDSIEQSLGADSEYDKELTEGGTPVHYVKADLDIDTDGFRTKEFYAPVAAISEDAGAITYKAQKRDYDNPGEVVGSTSEIRFIETTDTTRKTGKLYYYAVTTSGVTNYKLYTGDLDSDSVNGILGAISGTDGKVYEKVFVTLVDTIGWYTVTAYNRVRTATASEKSYTIEVPRPVDVEITKNLPAKAIIEGNLDNDAKEDDYMLTIDVTSRVADRGKMTYQWFYKAPGEKDFVALEGETGPSLSIRGYAVQSSTPDAEAPGGYRYKYTLVTEDGKAAGDGYYYCQITNNLNMEYDEDKTDEHGKRVRKVCVNPKNSDTIRVSHKATAPVVELVSRDAYSLSEIASDECQLEIRATIPADCGEMVDGWRTEDDTITYVWYRYYSNGNSVADDIQAAIDGTYVINHDDNLIEEYTARADRIAKDIAENVYVGRPEADLQKALADKAKYEELAAEAATNHFNPIEAGCYYFCQATNTYNGTKASTLSRFFSVSNA